MTDETSKADKMKKAAMAESAAGEQFNPDEARHKVSTTRLKIAQWVLIGLGVLIAGAMVLLYFLPIEGKREILASVISSLFSALTLTIGFVAGSSIDNNR